jgi:type II secretory pathway pseudopilin PulG
MAISFSCPSCGAIAHLDDNQQGQNVLCSRCGMVNQVTLSPALPPVIAAATPAWAANTAANTAEGTADNSSTLILGLTVPIFIVLLFVGLIFCGGVGVALMLPAVYQVRESARNSTCKNQLRQISMAIETYKAVHGTYPPAYSVDEQGKPLHGWRTLILPHMLGTDSFDQIRMEEPWDSPHNSQFHDRQHDLFGCPSNPNSRSTKTSYVAIVGPGMIFSGPKATAANAVPSLSDTILLIEIAESDIHWMEPRDVKAADLARAMRHDVNRVDSHHNMSVNVAYADGAVQAMPKTELSAKRLRSLLTVDPKD